MRTIAISDIHISPNRQRREFDPEHIQSLADSMVKLGLFHPPVLKLDPQHGLTLVAGENRLRAMALAYELGDSIRYDNADIPLNHTPYNLIGELDELAAEEAELDENLKRKDLTWQEHSAAVKRLDDLRRKQKGEAHTVTALAEELTGRTDGSYRETVRQELILAKHLDNPVIAKAKSSTEAFKLLKKEEQKQSALGRAAAFDAETTRSRHTLLQGDCVQWMWKLHEQGKRYDVILTDPPYGMNAQNFGDGAGRMSAITHEYNDTEEHWQHLMAGWAELSFLLAAEKAHAYVFCDIERFQQLKTLMQDAGWYVHRTPFIYYKTDGGRVPLPEIGPRRCWEMCLYAIKGKRPVTNIYPDVICATADANLGHGAQKPVACYQNLLQRSCLPGDKVLDTFCGTGTIFVAAQNMKCIATGIELDPASFGIAAKRLEGLGE